MGDRAGAWTWVRSLLDHRRNRLVLAVLVGTLLSIVLLEVTPPWPGPLAGTNPTRTAMQRSRVAAARDAGAPLELRQEWIPLEQISPELVRAVVVAEDSRFYDHGGVDWAALAEEVHYDGAPPFSWFDPRDLRALASAADYYRAHRSEIRGRSTITQQLVKNIYFGSERSLLRKIKELVVARGMERRLGKDRILELYLNTAEWGPGLFGVEAAARHYFGRAAADLSRFQAASLAATLPHPLTSNPDRSPGRMAWRRDLILERLAGRGRTEEIPRPEEISVPEITLPPTAPEESDSVWVVGDTVP